MKQLFRTDLTTEQLTIIPVDKSTLEIFRDELLYKSPTPYVPHGKRLRSSRMHCTDPTRKKNVIWILKKKKRKGNADKGFPRNIYVVDPPEM